MKKAFSILSKLLIKSIVVFVFCSLFTFAIFQTKWAKRYLTSSLIELAALHNIELSIGEIRGRLPFEWIIDHAEFKMASAPQITAKTVKMRINAFSLIKKKINIYYLHVDQGNCEATSFTADLKAAVYLKGASRFCNIEHLTLENSDFTLQMNGKISRNWEIQSLFVAFSSNNLSSLSPFLPYSLAGSIKGRFEYSEDTLKLKCESQQLSFENFPFLNSSFSLHASKTKHQWKGKCSAFSIFSNLSMDASTSFEWAPSLNWISVNDLIFHAPQTQLCGFFNASLDQKIIKGTLFGNTENLSHFNAIFPNEQLKGKCGFRFDFFPKDNQQSLVTFIRFEDVQRQELQVKNAAVSARIKNLFHSMNGHAHIEAQGIALNALELSDLECDTELNDDHSPFSLLVKGRWHDPIEVMATGNWNPHLPQVAIHWENISGFVLSKAFSLKSPCVCEMTAESFKLSPCTFDIDRGLLFARIDHSPSSSLMKIQGKHFPLELLNLFQNRLQLKGLASFDWDLFSWKPKLQGHFFMQLEQAEVFSGIKEQSFKTKGSLQLHLNDAMAQVNAELCTTDHQFLSLHASIPVALTDFPFLIKINEDMPFSAELTSEGKLEDLFDFINIGAHRLSGKLSCHLLFSKTLSSPFVQGKFHLQNGIYENYMTGTSLKHIKAEAIAHNKDIKLVSFTATDPQEEGDLSATGKITLSMIEQFPFAFDVQLNNLHAISFETLEGKLKGLLHIQGNKKSAVAKGQLEATYANFKIPDHLPGALTDLPMTYVNFPDRIQKKSAPDVSVYPLYLDIDLDVPKNGQVTGKGVNSKWEGALHLSGTYLDIAAKGKLNLVKGDYLFLGKMFSLNSGEIVFYDQPAPSAYLSLSGSCQIQGDEKIQGANVDVFLRGPLTSPALSFQSMPQMPISTLLSRILFNEDPSKISPLQGLQLAQTILSLSGQTTPFFLDKIRKTLGIDRINIVSLGNDPHQVSLQIGKYLMQGVMLSLSSGANERQVAVEVELNKGFIFKAEVDQNEQGKFSLKWHHHY